MKFLKRIIPALKYLFGNSSPKEIVIESKTLYKFILLDATKQGFNKAEMYGGSLSIVLERDILECIKTSGFVLIPDKL